MSSLEQIYAMIPDFAEDVGLKLTFLVADETHSPQPKYGLLLASTTATRNTAPVAAMEPADDL
ncbi:hypothetical protein SAMN05216525_13036 [Bradyrhizobium sp. Gha]|nr:hypothetical protein SAMN05216525_13036 [Bradyrhizobium sp. Gha]